MYPTMCIPSSVSLLSPLVILVVSIITKAQKFPTRDDVLFEHQMRHPETFHDSSLLPDGAEVRVSIPGDQPHMYFFMVEEDNTPLAISVTPCQAQLQWNLSIHELPEDGSGSIEEDQLSEQKSQKKPTSSKQGTVVKNYTGYDASTYLTYNSPAGIYILEVRSLEDFASFRIYSTTTPESDHLYPELPTDPRLDITSSTKNRVSLAWKASPSDTLYRDPIKYCVTMSTRKHYHTWCSVEALTDGEEPEVIPTHSGFGFDGERENKRNLRKRKRKYKKERERNAEQGDESDDDIVVECVGSKTLHTFTNLEPARKYYFDLFAVHEITNRSSTYMGTSILTRNIESSRKTIILKDAKLRTSTVRRAQPVKIFTFNIGAETRDVLISLQPCTLPVIMEVYKGDEEVRTTRVRNLKSMTIRNVEGDLKIKVKGVQKRTSHFRIFVTTKASKYPFPSLPEDYRIKVLENLRESECTSITVAWLTTNELSQYCLYMRKDTDQSSRRQSAEEIIEPDNYCHAPEMRKKIEKVVCRIVNGAEAERDVLTETVTGLTANTRYIFDVYVSSYGKQTLAYRSANAKTKKRC